MVFLRRIWDHLVHLTKDGGTTIIVTTHYIDETRQAHMVIITCIIMIIILNTIHIFQYYKLEDHCNELSKGDVTPQFQMIGFFYYLLKE